MLYPLGITSECVMVFKALGPAGELVSPLYKWFLVAVLGIYVPGEFYLLPWGMFEVCFCLRACANCLGSYILYTHMIAQRRKALKKK